MFAGTEGRTEGRWYGGGDESGGREWWPYVMASGAAPWRCRALKVTRI
ncbi:MAG: hypothetical protein LBQ12_11620 [Deltaproteobacteria bacterium]|nr:hypothetical protein [Deltaproteobacteria bacterium]